jgi:hypothetical protein
MTDAAPFRQLLRDFETKVQEVNEQVVGAEVRSRTQNTRQELQIALRHSLAQYATLKYFGEFDPEIQKLPPEVREAERQKMNEPVRKVVSALVYCRNNSRVTGNDLLKLKNTTFKNWPSHLDISVVPDLLNFGRSFARLAQIQSDLEGDPAPVPDCLATLPAADPPEDPAIAE